MYVAFEPVGTCFPVWPKDRETCGICDHLLRTDLHGRLKNSKIRDGKLQEASTG